METNEDAEAEDTPASSEPSADKAAAALRGNGIIVSPDAAGGTAG